MRVLAYQTSLANGKVLLEESTGQKVVSSEPDVLFAFLLEPQGNSAWAPQFDRCLRVCWDLDAAVAPILKLIGKSACIKLHQTHKAFLKAGNTSFSLF